MWQPGWEGNLGESGYMYIYIYMAESLHSSSEIITTLLMGYTQYKIVLFFLKNGGNIPKCFFQMSHCSSGSRDEFMYEVPSFTAA